MRKRRARHFGLTRFPATSKNNFLVKESFLIFMCIYTKRSNFKKKKKESGKQHDQNKRDKTWWGFEKQIFFPASFERAMERSHDLDETNLRSGRKCFLIFCVFFPHGSFAFSPPTPHVYKFYLYIQIIGYPLDSDVQHMYTQLRPEVS